MINLDPIWLEKDYEEYCEKRVLLVAVPLPPVPVSGLIFGPQGYASKSYDKWDSQHPDFKIVTVKFDDVLGPVILVSTKLSKLLDFNSVESRITVLRSTYCASVSYHNMSLFNANYADEVVVDDLRPIASSCHPGSHYVIPQAPCLTAMLQAKQAPKLDNDTRANMINGFEYLNPQQGEILFPTVNWERNRLIEEHVSKWPADVSMSRLANGPGEWAREYLNKLRRNRYGHQFTNDTRTSIV